MSKYGPGKGELQFRLVFSALGLVLLVAALFFRGIPQGAAMFEIVVIASVFFGGTFVWTLKKLLQRGYTDDR